MAAVASRRVEEATRFLGDDNDIILYTDLHDLVADPAIHGVVIASHTDEHKAVPAVGRAGKAIFCEKPLALTLADVDLMLAAVNRAGVLFPDRLHASL
ncbi:MAG: Gfo/Idh/MocA family oxidoreductase [Caldilineaceae bacterium]